MNILSQYIPSTPVLLDGSCRFDAASTGTLRRYITLLCSMYTRGGGAVKEVEVMGESEYRDDGIGNGTLSIAFSPPTFESIRINILLAW